MSGGRKQSKPPSLRHTLLFTYFIAAIICVMVGVYNFLSSQFLLQRMTTFAEVNQQLSEVQTMTQTFQDNISDYLFSRNSVSLQSYYDNQNRLEKIVEQLQDESGQQDIRYVNLGGNLSHYLSSAEDLIVAKRNQKNTEYVKYYESVSYDFRLINQYMQSLMASELQESSVQYYEMQQVVTIRTALSYGLFGASIFFVVFLLINLSNNVSRPITRLAGYARRVAEGDYSIDICLEQENLEFKQLYESFEVMVENTRLYLESLKEKQKLENELAQQQIMSLEKDNLLQEAELHALHAQMNPHFIFNTINIGAKIAMLSGDEVVCEYLENAADVFRYNLAGLDNATLEEELGNVEAYMKLLTTRFGPRLKFDVQVDETVALKGVTLPRMTLQPLVENAFVHGVNLIEEGGQILLKISSDKDDTIVVIANTGPEFPKEKIEALYTEEFQEHRGHLSGIGLKNVYRRLQIVCRCQRPVEIVSADGWTQVRLKLPAE